MKKLLLGALMLLFWVLPSAETFAQTLLSKSDIVIIHAEGDTNSNDFAFVVFKELSAGTEIYFTDCGTFAVDGVVQQPASTNFNMPCAPKEVNGVIVHNDGVVKYTAPSTIPVGAIIRYSTSSANFAPFNNTLFTGSFDLDVAGDQIIAFQPASGTSTIGANANYIFMLDYNSAVIDYGAPSSDDNRNRTDVPVRGNSPLSDSGAFPSLVLLGNGSGSTADPNENVVYQGSYKFANLSQARKALATRNNFARVDDEGAPSYTEAKSRIPAAISFGSDMLITEFMPAPGFNSAGDPTKPRRAEYIELYNTTGSEINLNGWTIEDLNGNVISIASEETDNSDTKVGPGEFYVLTNDGNSQTNGNIIEDYAYTNSFFLQSLSPDDIILKDGSGDIIDRVSYQPGLSVQWPQIIEGSAYVFIGREDEDNNDGYLWAIATQSERNGAVLVSNVKDKGSPGYNGQDQYLEDRQGLTTGVASELDNTSFYENGSWSNGVPGNTPDLNAVVVTGSPNFSGSIILNSLQVRSDAAVTIPAGSSITLDRSLTVRGTLIFASSASGNGELGIVPPTLSYYGDVTTQAYYSDARSWSMITSAVTTTGTRSMLTQWQESTAPELPANSTSMTGMHITGSPYSNPGPIGYLGPNGFDITETNNPSLLELNHETQRLEAIEKTNVPLEAGVPYFAFVIGNRSVDLLNSSSSSSTKLIATGKLKTGEVDEYRSNPPAESFDGLYFEMYGNPYQATLDMTKVLSNSNTFNINTGQYYVYDALVDGDISATAVGASVTVDLSTNVGMASVQPFYEGSTTTGENSSSANEFLQPGQGFQVAMQNKGDSRLVFKEDDKVLNQFAPIRSKYDDYFKNPIITGNLYGYQAYGQEGSKDGFIIAFDEKFTNEGSYSEDAPKVFNIGVNIATSYEDKTFAIDRRAMPKVGDVIPLFMNNLKAKGYTYNIRVGDLQSDLVPVFVDNFTGNRTILEKGNNPVDFLITEDAESIATDRFSIVFENSLSLSTQNLLGTAVYPNPTSTNSITINSAHLINKSVTVTVVDLLGRTVYDRSVNFENSTFRLNVNDWSDGVYVLTVKSEGVTDTHRVVKQ